MAILLETDETAAVALRSAIGPDTALVDSMAAVYEALAADEDLDLVVIGADVDAGLAFDLASAQRIVRPALGVLLLRNRLHTGLLRDAMLAGIREVVPSNDHSALAEACRRSQALSDQVRGGRSVRKATGQVVTVFSAKGGAGKTTISTNLAVVLAQTPGRRVCLLDLDLAFGDVAIAMQLSPTRTVAEAVGLSTLDEVAVKPLITQHPSGLDTILAPAEPGAAERIPGALIGDLLKVLKTMYDVVVVDTPPALNDHVLAAFDQSDHFVLLATLDVPALKNLKLTLETLDMLRYPRDRYHVVLNRSDAKVGLTVRDVQSTLRTEIAAEIPSSRAVPASINRGVPIVLDEPMHPVSTAIRQFAETRLLPQEAPVQRPRRFSLRRKPEPVQ
jgi:pilus assembly protein CpaE